MSGASGKPPSLTLPLWLPRVYVACLAPVAVALEVCRHPQSL